MGRGCRTVVMAEVEPGHNWSGCLHTQACTFFSFSKQIYPTTNIMGGAANASILALSASQHTFAARLYTRIPKFVSPCASIGCEQFQPPVTLRIYTASIFTILEYLRSNRSPCLPCMQEISDPENHHIRKTQQKRLSTPPLFGLHHRLFDYAKKKKREKGKPNSQSP